MDARLFHKVAFLSVLSGAAISAEHTDSAHEIFENSDFGLNFELGAFSVDIYGRVKANEAVSGERHDNQCPNQRGISLAGRRRLFRGFGSVSACYRPKYK